MLYNVWNFNQREHKSTSRDLNRRVFGGILPFWGPQRRDKSIRPLQKSSYNFEHNYGHGEQHLSVVFATLMMLAFLVDQTQQLCCALFRAVWTKLGSQRLGWERRRAWCYDSHLESRRQRLEALLAGLKTPNPIFAVDASSSPSLPSATAFHQTRRDAIVRGNLYPNHPTSPLSTRHPVISDPERCFKRQKRMVETLAELSATMVA